MSTEHLKSRKKGARPNRVIFFEDHALSQVQCIDFEDIAKFISEDKSFTHCLVISSRLLTCRNKRKSQSIDIDDLS